MDILSTVQKHTANYGKYIKFFIKYFSDEQVKKGLPPKHLVQDVPTRWNSTYDMLCSIFENRFAIVGVLSFTKYGDLLPSMYDWSLIESLINFLRPFKLGTQFFQTENQVSISTIYPSLHNLQVKHTMKMDNDPNIIREMKKNMGCALQSIINEYKSDFLLVATMLDPR